MEMPYSCGMEIIRAKVLGYCMGVKRAVDCAERALEENGAGGAAAASALYTLGPLIHNPSVLQELSGRGLRVLDAAQDDFSSLPPDSVVIVRAHGTTPDVLAALTAARARIVDATCPRVHLSQRRAEEWSGKGFAVIIAGDKNHGEVTSISGFAAKGATASGAEGCVCVVQDSAEAEQLAVPEKAVLIAQTTFSPLEFEKIAQVLRQKNPSIILFNSICSATMERQNALRELAGCVDGMLVVGGCSSANTRRLFETAQSLCPAAALIETAAQIPAQFFGLARVGITAGASTPDSVIVAVEEALRSGAC